MCCRRPSVPPSVTSRYCIETTGRIELGFVTEASFHLSIPHWVVRKFGLLQKLGYSLWHCVPNSEFRKFRHSSRSRCQQNSSSSSSTVELVDDTCSLYDSRRVAAVYYTSVNCNPLTLLGPNAICCGWICCTTFGLQCFRTVGWASGRASGL